ncbi:MAG TPA: hypothetical protein VEI49_05820, partial [Terriglobales bacterium]|nr:hypothetical protein [Terriglobales bacterium]
MKTRHLVFVTTVLLWFSTFATADRVVVGTTLTPCCPGGADFILPGDFLAQSFVLNQTTYVTSISFTTALYNIPPNPDGATPIDYPTLTFQMQLTNAIGFGAMQSNVLATKEFTMPSNSTSTVLSFSVDMTLPRGTYYLVASTQTPIPNASRVVGWGIAANYFPNTGPELVAFEGVSIWDAVNGICPWVTCSTNVNFPPAS